MGQVQVWKNQMETPIVNLCSLHVWQNPMRMQIPMRKIAWVVAHWFLPWPMMQSTWCLRNDGKGGAAQFHHGSNWTDNDIIPGILRKFTVFWFTVDQLHSLAPARELWRHIFKVREVYRKSSESLSNLDSNHLSFGAINSCITNLFWCKTVNRRHSRCRPCWTPTRTWAIAGPGWVPCTSWVSPARPIPWSDCWVKAVVFFGAPNKSC